ncbi:AlwI family type II restriction endonuclease [Helicobacter japonicus]|uniref:AlwI family type II restriction endonuclease n=2 Tax=Helicobacter japonicus TaxID=425400 RepID=A0A4U8TJS2_9HELI|nr:AlwI family type II restriction endonuclease [Helicobacter japonicus]TLE00567.1 AlwI family type II restriction endonuclease [Helicobacter japonicus]
MSNKKVKYKILSFSTTMRNPQRIADFLKALLPFENYLLTHEVIMQVIEHLIKNKIYIPNYANGYFRDIVESDEVFNEQQIKEIIENSPQNHKEAGFNWGWDSRFDTFYKLPMEFGFCFYAMNQPLIISHTGHLLIDAINEIPSNEAKIANIFLNCMMKYQRNNPFRSVLNVNVPLLLLLNTMNLLKEEIGDSKIHILEVPFLLCWRDDNYNALAHYILDFRREYPSFAYSREIIYEKCLNLLDSNNSIRFKISQVCDEAVDEYIRKMRITGIISLRGNGRFIDFNTFEIPKIDYVLENYSHFQTFDDKQSYFAYMGVIDSHILEVKEQININQDSLKQQTLEFFAMQYSKEQIYQELSILSSKNAKSKDEILKFIGEPTRFEFLTAIALRQHFSTLEIVPNYSIDDEGLPKCHASGNQPDIFCKDNISQSIFEVSLICGRGQVNNELLPIARHLKEMIESNKDSSLKFSYFAVFIAPKIFEDSKRYVKFIQFDEGLDIRNLDILEFVEKLKITSMKSNSINEAFNLEI